MEKITQPKNVVMLVMLKYSCKENVPITLHTLRILESYHQ